MEAQKDFNSLPGSLQPWHIGVGVALAGAAGICATHPEVIGWLAAAGIAAGIAWYAAEKQRLLREAKARASSYMNIVGPVVIGSTEPNETVSELLARVEAFKEQLALSENPYAAQIPVIALPYSPMMFGVGSLTLAWNIYQRQIADRQHLENMKWEKRCPEHLKSLFLSQVMGLVEEKLEA
jgi:hypothetical protein